MAKEKVTDIISSSSDTITTVDGIITSIYKSYIRKYERSEDYLETVILEKGSLSNKDLEIAARLYAIPMLRKKYKNIANTLNKADVLCEKRVQETGEKVTDVSGDWISYFMDRASIISEESIQSIFACLLTQECCENGTVRKVMIDRLALLDKKSAQIFIKLCQLTFSVKVSDGRDYCIPLYLRDNILVELVKSKSIDFSEEQAVEYQKFLTFNDLESEFQLSDFDSELDILQEIGLIKLSEDGDECDIYSSNSTTFNFLVGEEKISQLSLFDKKQNVYYVCTGNITYTKMGLELYNSIKAAYPLQYHGLKELLKAYIESQEK